MNRTVSQQFTGTAISLEHEYVEARFYSTRSTTSRLVSTYLVRMAGTGM